MFRTINQMIITKDKDRKKDAKFKIIKIVIIFIPT